MTGRAAVTRNQAGGPGMTGRAVVTRSQAGGPA
jgi:hypothetical protein